MSMLSQHKLLGPVTGLSGPRRVPPPETPSRQAEQLPATTTPDATEPRIESA
jgi:hypothetical protein